MKVKYLSEMIRAHNEESSCGAPINYRLELHQSSVNTLRLLCWQPIGKIDYNASTGFRSVNDDHASKADAFRKVAKDCGAAIAFTPEYSFPVSSIEAIIQDESCWPDQHKLWCFALEGMSKDDCERIENAAGDTEKVIMLKDEECFLSHSSFYACLYYIFLSLDGSLVLLPQYKIQQAADRLSLSEGSDMSFSDTVYVIDSLEDNSCSLALATIICADALVNLEELRKCMNSSNFDNFFLFHPQLNPSPNHNAIVSCYRSFFSSSCEMILSLNWGGSTDFVNDSQKPCGGHTTLYLKERNSVKPEQASQNSKHNFIHYESDHRTSWISMSDEAVFEILFRLGDSRGATPHKVLKAPHQFKTRVFESGQWAMVNVCTSENCSLDVDWLNDHVSTLNLPKCDFIHSKSCRILHVDSIFNSIWWTYKDSEEWDEYQAVRQGNNLKLGRTGLRIQCERISRTLIEEKRVKILSMLNEIVHEGKYPKWFEPFVDNGLSFVVNTAGFNVVDRVVDEDRMLPNRARIVFYPHVEVRHDLDNLKRVLFRHLKNENEDLLYFTVCFFQEGNDLNYFHLRTKERTGYFDDVCSPTSRTH